MGEEDGCKVGEGQSVRCITHLPAHLFSLYQFFPSSVRSLSAVFMPLFSSPQVSQDL